MFRRTQVLPIVTMVVGALLGYAVASGKWWNPFPQTRAAAGPEGQAVAQPSDPVSEGTPEAGCCSEEVRKGELLALANHNAAVAARAEGAGKKPNILVIMGDDIGQTNVSAYSMGLMGYRTPNIDRIAKEGMIFTDYYVE